MEQHLFERESLIDFEQQFLNISLRTPLHFSNYRGLQRTFVYVNYSY